MLNSCFLCYDIRILFCRKAIYAPHAYHYKNERDSTDNTERVVHYYDSGGDGHQR